VVFRTRSNAPNTAPSRLRAFERSAALEKVNRTQQVQRESRLNVVRSSVRRDTEPAKAELAADQAASMRQRPIRNQERHMAKAVKFKPAANPWAGVAKAVAKYKKSQGRGKGSGRKGTNGGKPGGS
jgi:hypothetical protein